MDCFNNNICNLLFAFGFILLSFALFLAIYTFIPYQSALLIGVIGGLLVGYNIVERI